MDGVACRNLTPVAFILVVSCFVLTRSEAPHTDTPYEPLPEPQSQQKTWIHVYAMTTLCGEPSSGTRLL